MNTSYLKMLIKIMKASIKDSRNRLAMGQLAIISEQTKNESNYYLNYVLYYSSMHLRVIHI